jgi:hypothetical protein
MEHAWIELLGYEYEFGKVTAVKQYGYFYRGPAGKSTKNRQAVEKRPSAALPLSLFL